MKLYLVQHGIAVPEEVDPQKPLSQEGKAQTQKMADYLRLRNIMVDCLWHSHKLRARQTASILAPSVSASEIQERDDINPLDPVSSFPEKIQSLRKDVMIVGHLPFLAKLASLLLAGSEENPFIAFRNSGVVCMEYEEIWKMLWALTPELV
ncbi:MAG: phosphohistidine phosphatase SixA [Candidatus Aminicenantales bacterium]